MLYDQRHFEETTEYGNGIHQCNKINRPGYTVGAAGLNTALQADRSRVRFPMRSIGIFIDLILPTTLCSWGDSATNINEYQDYLLGGKGGRCVGLITLILSCADCLEILGVSNS